MTLRVATVVGARPQFVKAGPVSRALRAAGHDEILIHTGQHHDREMSQVFFDELGLAEPDVNLGVGSGPHGRQTGQMLQGIEEVLLAERPDRVLVYGDTNSTLAGALAAAKLQIPVAHVEAGLRSFNRAMPEEHNRVLTDHCADLLLCPTTAAVRQLAREGVTARVELVGDPMLDALLEYRDRAIGRGCRLFDELALPERGYLFATIHRPYNTDSPEVLRRILGALDGIGEPVVLAVHPRTRERIDDLEGGAAGLGLANVRLVPPVGYLDSIHLQQRSRLVVTDSGGMQKEAYFLGVPCVTLRPETEWTETVEAGWNRVVGSDPDLIQDAVRTLRPPPERPPFFGDGHAAEAIVGALGYSGTGSIVGGDQ